MIKCHGVCIIPVMKVHSPSCW